MKQQNLTIFVNCNLLSYEEGCRILREYLMDNSEILKYSKITGISDGQLDIEEPPMSFSDVHLSDPVLCAYDNQAVYDGFIKLTLDSLMRLLDRSMPN